MKIALVVLRVLLSSVQLPLAAAAAQTPPAGAADGGWAFRAPRAEIAPRAWVDREVTHEGAATLALAGRGSAAVDGCWTRAVEVEPGSFVRFEAWYRAEKVEEQLRCILARVVWRGADGGRVEQPEYPATVQRCGPDGWGRVLQTYRVPEGAARAELELIYRWDADGEVRFGSARLEPVAAPAPRTVRVAAVHHRPSGNRTAAENVEEFCRFVARAGAAGADFVCLPEGITVVGTGQSYVEASEPVPGPTAQRLGAAAREHGLHIIAGVYEREGAAVYNTAVVIGPDGALLGKYRKVCLPREEIEGGITPGDDLPVFDTAFGRIGVMICWDVFFPEPARVLARKGAEIIFLPIWGGNLTLARARAIENQVYLVSSTYDMKTAVFDREGEILGEATDADPVVIRELDLDERTLWPWLGAFRARIPREMPALRAWQPEP